jgi:hypothetical protein
MEKRFKGTFNEKMEHGLNEVMPEFDKEAEWVRLAGKLQKGNARRIALYRVRVAAALIMLLGGGWLVWLLNRGDSRNMVTASTESLQTDVAPNNSPDTVPVSQTAQPVAHEEAKVETKDATASATIRRKRDVFVNRHTNAGFAGGERFMNHYFANEFVCNGTPCPIEICIVQTFHCPGDEPSEVATCSTLAPDEARQLRYKAPVAKHKDCSVTVDEIRIKRVSTGETIVLNAESKPSTAQELFSCITGQTKCNILAGIFDEDCNNDHKPQSLTISNNGGNLVLE